MLYVDPYGLVPLHDSGPGSWHPGFDAWFSVWNDITRERPLPPLSEADNKEKNGVVNFLDYHNVFQRDRDALTKNLEDASTVDLQGARPEDALGIKVGHISYEKDKMSKGDIVGTFGASPCTGVICDDKANDRITVFHFACTENVKGTLEKYKFDKGAEVYIFGALDLNDNSDSNSRNEGLEDAIDYFQDLGIRIYQSETTGLWMDKDGNVFTFEEDRTR